MGWVRYHRRYGAWPGLAALVLQLVLSFGHIHIGNVHVADVHFFGKMHLGNLLFGGAAHASDVAASRNVAQAPQKSPAQHPGDDDNYCAICASIFLTSTSFVAQPPQLPVPVGFERITLTFSADHGISAPRHVLFQSRAPPAA